MEKETLDAIFQRLKSILKKYESSLIVKTDKEDMYYLDTEYVMKFNKANLLFGSVVREKDEVKFYLNPVILFPELLEGISSGLQENMDGKPFFSFSTMDETLFTELEELTKKGVEKFQREGAIGIIFH